MGRRAAILAAVGLCLVWGGAVEDAAGAAAQSETLEEGAIGLDIWEVSTRRPKVGRDARDRPCLDVLIAKRVGSYYEASKFEVCGAVAPVPTVIDYSIGQGGSKRTVIAMAFGAGVRRIMVDLGSRGKRRIEPRLLPRAAARKVGLARFRFAVIALAGSHCLHRVLGTEADGTVAIDKKYSDCV